MAGRPTLADVAALAGVSLKTASRAMNGEYGVAEATADRVREAARTLGFRLNHLARALASRQTSAAVGLIVPGVSDPFMAALVAEVEAVLAPRELQLVSASHGDDAGRQRMIIRTLVERRVDALIVVSSPGDASYLQPDLDHGLVVVAIDRPLTGISVDTVTVDNRAASRITMSELLAAGHRRVALLGFDPRVWTESERYQGYCEALQSAGLPLKNELVALSATDSAEVQVSVTRMLERPDPPTAVVAIQHRAGRAAIRAMLDTGARLDLTVFDDVADPDLLVIPPLTVVASNPVRLGAAAAVMTLERLDGLDGPARSTVLPAHFEHPRNAATPPTASPAVTTERQVV